MWSEHPCSTCYFSKLSLVSDSLVPFLFVFFSFFCPFTSPPPLFLMVIGISARTDAWQESCQTPSISPHYSCLCFWFKGLRILWKTAKCHSQWADIVQYNSNLCLLPPSDQLARLGTWILKEITDISQHSKIFIHVQEYNLWFFIEAQIILLHLQPIIYNNHSHEHDFSSKNDTLSEQSFKKIPKESKTKWIYMSILSVVPQHATNKKCCS